MVQKTINNTDDGAVQSYFVVFFIYSEKNSAEPLKFMIFDALSIATEKNKNCLQFKCALVVYLKHES